ncbi:hypothetical protein LXL04_017290 [Taraxacum kok-saghyz]
MATYMKSDGVQLRSFNLLQRKFNRYRRKIDLLFVPILFFYNPLAFYSPLIEATGQNEEISKSESGFRASGRGRGRGSSSDGSREIEKFQGDERGSKADDYINKFKNDLKL